MQWGVLVGSFSRGPEWFGDPARGGFHVGCERACEVYPEQIVLRPYRLPGSLLSLHCTLPVVLVPACLIDEKPRLSIQVTGQVAQSVRAVVSLSTWVPSGHTLLTWKTGLALAPLGAVSAHGILNEVPEYGTGPICVGCHCCTCAAVCSICKCPKVQQS